jgi:hypothetical protein
MAEQRPAPGTAADLTARIAALEAENAQLRAAATARAAAGPTGPDARISASEVAAVRSHAM